MRIFGNIVGTIVLAALILGLLWVGFVTLPSIKCESIAQAMGRPYIFQPVNGCWVQTVQGNWQRVDQPVNPNYQQ